MREAVLTAYSRHQAKDHDLPITLTASALHLEDANVLQIIDF
jgi:hypothetical protein